MDFPGHVLRIKNTVRRSGVIIPWLTDRSGVEDCAGGNRRGNAGVSVSAFDKPTLRVSSEHQRQVRVSDEGELCIKTGKILSRDADI